MPSPSRTKSEHAEWLRANQQDLLTHLSSVKHRLARYVGQTKTEQVAFPGAPKADPKAKKQTKHPSALAGLVTSFNLSPFERDTLLLCAGMELDDEFPALCAAAQQATGDEPAYAHPTFSIALAALAEPHWSAVTSAGPLRYWKLVEVGAGPGLTRAPLRIDERILHFLAGERQLDARLEVLLEPLSTSAAEMLVPSQRVVAERVADVWAGATQGRDLQVVQLCGGASDCHPVAAAAAAILGLRAARLAAERLPVGAAELDSLLRLWEREAELSGLGILMVDYDDDVPLDSDAGRAASAAVARVMERATGPVILRAREPRRLHNRPSVILDVARPMLNEQLAVWRSILGEPLIDEKSLAAAAAQFSLSVPALRAIAIQARSQSGGVGHGDLNATVWELCRRRLRTALEGLAHRIESDQHWDDLVLPPAQKETLHEIAAQLRQRSTVHEQWGFGQKTRRGLGISALFHGPSGTGKTMAAEVLANELRLDLYHIDLSRVVSKYIGETEDNLRRIFDAAEANGAILLFDEADSLFGSRSEVKDSHDRYANIEVSYLLQRMESYRGLAILTTNMRSSLDSAFLRRIRFAVDFPFPDEVQRAAIWRRIFPPAAPTLGLDADRLARLRLAGGNIRNIALNAAFAAADSGEPVQMRHVRTAARTEYAKLDRRQTQTEAGAWA